MLPGTWKHDPGVPGAHRRRRFAWADGITGESVRDERERRLSEEERRVDALALRADERRDKLRKAAVSCK